MTIDQLRDVYIAREGAVGSGMTLTKLDQFAMAALGGLLANPKHHEGNTKAHASLAYEYGLAMWSESRQRNNP